MPQRVQPDSWVIATKAPSADVFVFDTSKQQEQQEGSGEEQQQQDIECRPDLRCTGALRLAWTPGGGEDMGE